MFRRHPEVPWVIYQQRSDGSFLAKNERTGQTVVADGWTGLHEFAADSARAPGHMGAGDAVAAVTNRLGIRKCAPCAQRQAALNRLAPSIWRR